MAPFLIWKNVTFSIGLLLLIIGRYYYQAPDWDIPVSIIMASFAYLTAGWAIDAIISRQWRKFPLAIFYTWWTVDGCYWLYWSLVNPDALVMREANFPASLCLYAICGLLWSNRLHINKDGKFRPFASVIP